MLNTQHDESRPSRVTVAFEHGAISFMMSKDATFEDLADRLDRLGKRRQASRLLSRSNLPPHSTHRRGLIPGLGRGRDIGAEGHLGPVTKQTRD